MAIDTVYLSELDGFSFQDLCVKIFEELGWGDATPFTTQDKGRDINIKTPQGSIIVECKHQPNSTIGRPIVQKLHSAAIYFDGIKGMVVTSGKFSDGAIQHAKELSMGNMPIELVDWHELRKLARKAGINIYESSDKVTPVIYGYQIDYPAMKKRLVDSFAGYKSSPNRATDMIKIKSWSVSTEYAYRVKYDLVQTFKSTTYVLKELKEYGQIVMVDSSGKSLSDIEVYEFVNKAPLDDFDNIAAKLNLENTIEARNMSDNFSIPRNELLRLAEDILIEKHTSSVKYKGKNKVTYKKKCVPSRKSIRIADVKQVVLAKYSVKIGILEHESTRHVIDNTESTRFMDRGIPCNTCENHLTDGEGQVCNACGHLTHARRMFNSCGFECKVCKMTICPACTKSTRRLLFFKKRLCGRCAAVATSGSA